MVIFKRKLNELYYTQHTLLNNIGQLLNIVRFYISNFPRLVGVFLFFFIIYYYYLLTTSLTQGSRIWDSYDFFIEGPNNKLL